VILMTRRTLAHVRESEKIDLVVARARSAMVRDNSELRRLLHARQRTQPCLRGTVVWGARVQVFSIPPPLLEPFRCAIREDWTETRPDRRRLTITGVAVGGRHVATCAGSVTYNKARSPSRSLNHPERYPGSRPCP